MQIILMVQWKYIYTKLSSKIQYIQTVEIKAKNKSEN